MKEFITRFRNKVENSAMGLAMGLEYIVAKVKDGDSLVGYVVASSENEKNKGFYYWGNETFVSAVQQGRVLKLRYDWNKKDVIGRDFDFKKYKKGLFSLQLRSIKKIRSDPRAILLIPMSLEIGPGGAIYVFFCMIASSYTAEEYKSRVVCPGILVDSAFTTHWGSMCYVGIPAESVKKVGVFPFSYIVESSGFENKYFNTSISALARKVVSSLSIL